MRSLSGERRDLKYPERENTLSLLEPLLRMS